MYFIEPFLHSTAMSSSGPLGAKCAHPVYNIYRTLYILDKEQLESAIVEVTRMCTCSCHFSLLMVLCKVFSRHTVILAISFPQLYCHSTQSNPQHSVKPTQLKAKPCVAINSHCVIVFSVSERRKKLLVKSKPSLFEREYTLFSQSSLQSQLHSTV